MDLKGSRDEIVAVLKQAQVDDEGLRVALNLGDVNAPCAFVQLETFEPYLAGGEATWRVYLVGAVTDEEHVLEQLSDLLTAVLELGVAPSADVEYVKLQIPEQPQPLPAFLVRVQDTV